jgi:hypothetical protein
MNDPYKNLGDAWDKLWADIYAALRIPEIVEWINNKLKA